MKHGLSLIVVGLILGIGAFSPNPIAQASPPQEWVFNPANLHYYKLLTNCSGWHGCENAAASNRAHLVTINDISEQTWITNTFGSDALYWIGYTDESSEGNWQWISGENATYMNWAPGEPSNSGNTEHYALMNWTVAGLWNDGHEAAVTGGAIIERESPPEIYLPLVLR